MRRLAEGGVLVIAAGGGGIPVCWRDGHLVGLDAVVDKDRCAAELAVSLQADMLVLVTSVPRVEIGFGTPASRVALRLTVSDAQHHLDEGEFPPGSMGPEDRGGGALRGRRRKRRDHRLRASGHRGARPPRHMDRAGPRRALGLRVRAGGGMSWQVRTLPDRYADSVRLMGIARALRDHEGVSACEVVMGTPANLSALAALGASAEAGPGDVVVAVDGEDGLGDAVLAEVQRLLVGGAAQSERGTGRRRAPSPRSTRPTSRSSRCPASTRRSRPIAR